VTPLRIALVITELEVGGAEQSLVRLATGLDPARFAPVVYSLAPLPSPGNDRLVRELTNARIEVHSLNARGWWHFVPAVRQFRALLRRQQPQIVQTFLFHANVVGLLAARQASVPHVLLGVRVADPSWWRGTLERSLAGSASGVVCVSQAVADYCRQQHRFPAAKLIVIPNGIDVASIASTPPVDLTTSGIPAGKNVLAYVGRLAAQKGTDWLVRDVAPAVLAKLPDHHLLLVGDGPQRRELERIANRGEFAGRIHFAGQRNDALGIMAASQLLLLTSRHEGMPNTVLEAMALGLPVVATSAEGVEELLGEGADAHIASFGDTARFAARVIALAQDPSRRQAAGEYNAARAGDHFSLSAMVGSYARLYEGLAAS
jgi:glycosyltransferase involved in cell wall biosynthesis